MAKNCLGVTAIRLNAGAGRLQGKSKRKKNVRTTQYFIDEVMLHDLETNLTTELKLVRKWVHGFVEKVLAKYDLAELNRGKGLLGIERIPELQEPLDIAYNDYGLWINSQYLTL